MATGLIIKALSGFYYVLDDQTGATIECRARGKFRQQAIKPLVGDHVEYEAEHTKEGYVLGVNARHNALVRPPIANVDQAFIVMSTVIPDFSTHLVDKFILLAQYHDIQPVICVTKMDIIREQERQALLAIFAQYRQLGYEVIELGLDQPEAYQQLAPFIANEVSVLAGQSGAGKSTLLNQLNSAFELQTGEVSKSLGRGRHTTRHVELLHVCQGFVADTPGFSQLELTEFQAEDVTQAFGNFSEYSSQCKFRGCSHLNEPKCAVKAAVAAAEIPEWHYEHYVSFMEEVRQQKPRY
ncbi:MAG: ribosome small subunit-dependent GTPase A [Culicoidibacterales bacterium]